MDQLRDALRDFLKEICEYLASQPPIFREWTKIVSEDTGQVSFPREVRPDYTQIFLRLLLFIDKTQSPTFERLYNIVRRESRLSRAVFVDAAGKPIEEEEGQRYWLKYMLALNFVNIYINRTMGIQFDEQAFIKLFDEFRRDIESSDITVTELSPLMNVEIESDEIQIEPGIRLRQLSVNELEEWLNANMFFSAPPLAFHEITRLQCALEVISKRNRYTGSISISEKGSGVITAMHLTADGYPRLAFTQTRSSSFITSGSGMLSWGQLAIRFGPSIKISKSQESELIELFNHLGASPNLGVAKLALLRWNSSGDRSTEEDKLIDYWIALESLFIPDSTQELSYRTALRIAIFLGSDVSERERIYEEIRDSYDLRSEIVHGSIRKRRRKIVASELINITRSYLRQALLKILGSKQHFDAKKLERLLLAKELRRD